MRSGSSRPSRLAHHRNVDASYPLPAENALAPCPLARHAPTRSAHFCLVVAFTHASLLPTMGSRKVASSCSGYEQKKPLGSFRSRGADPQPRTPLYGVCEVTTFASAAGALVDAVAAGEGAGVAETEPSADACAAACFSAASAAFPFFCFGWAFFAAVVR